MEICMDPTRTDGRSYDVVVLGAGCAGLMAALRLGRRTQSMRIALVNQHDQFLEKVRLQESIVAAVLARIPSRLCHRCHPGLAGRMARHVRNLFVWFIAYVLKLERRFPSFFTWPGQRRVSWHLANDAIRKTRAA